MGARLHIAERTPRARVAFAGRGDAGGVLASVLAAGPDPRALVLALPRGGVPVAVPVARALRCELRPVLARKLPVPANPEMGFGAVTMDGTVMLDPTVMRAFGITEVRARWIADDVRRELRRRAHAYPGGEGLPESGGRRVILVDDGLATGYTMVAACEMLRGRDALEVVVAVPVASRSSIREAARHCDELYCLIEQETPPFAVASFYRDFPDLTDDDVRALLEEGSR